jgi:hypothetical protein
MDKLANFMKWYADHRDGFGIEESPTRGFLLHWGGRSEYCSVVRLFELFNDGKCPLPDVTYVGPDVDQLPDISKLSLSGSFRCHQKGLTTLQGVPRHIKGNFVCSYNELRDLRGGPLTVGGHYDCHANRLIILEGAPKKVHGFDCHNNQLTNLFGGPTEVALRYDCSTNKLTSLRGAPAACHSFIAHTNRLQSLAHLPQTVLVPDVRANAKQFTQREAQRATTGYYLATLGGLAEAGEDDPRFIDADSEFNSNLRNFVHEYDRSYKVPGEAMVVGRRKGYIISDLAGLDPVAWAMAASDDRDPEAVAQDMARRWCVKLGSWQPATEAQKRGYRCNSNPKQWFTRQIMEPATLGGMVERLLA